MPCFHLMSVSLVCLLLVLFCFVCSILVGLDRKLSIALIWGKFGLRPTNAEVAKAKLCTLQCKIYIQLYIKTTKTLHKIHQNLQLAFDKGCQDQVLHFTTQNVHTKTFQLYRLRMRPVQRHRAGQCYVMHFTATTHPHLTSHCLGGFVSKVGQFSFSPTNVFAKTYILRIFKSQLF